MLSIGSDPRAVFVVLAALFFATGIGVHVLTRDTFGFSVSVAGNPCFVFETTHINLLIYIKILLRFKNEVGF